MKRFVLGIALLLISINVFAQSKRYNELLATGKSYEKQKNYVYALGYYYDAMDEEPDNCTEAFNSFVKLADTLRGGNPGYGKFDSFTLHDEWRRVLINAERYWTEFPPVGIKIKEVKQSSINYKTRTGDYEVKYVYFLTDKFYDIWSIVTEGCKKARTSNWTDFPSFGNIDRNDFPYMGQNPSWPFSSIFKKSDGSVSQIYNKYGVALISDKGNDYYSIYDTRLFGTLEWLFTGKEFISVNSNDLRFSVFNTNGKEIVSGKRRLINKSETYYLTGVPQNVMTLLEEKKASVKLSGFFIQYGYLDSDLLINSYTEEQRPIVANLPDVGIPVRKIDSNLWRSAYLVAQEKQKARKEAVDAINKLLKDEKYDQVLTQIEDNKSNGINLSLEDFGLNNEELNKKVLIKKMKIAYSNKDYSRVENLIAYATSKGIKVSTQDINIASEEFERVKKNAQKKAYDDHKKSYSKNVFEVRKNFEEKYFVILPKTNILMAKTELTDFSINKPEVCKWITAIELCNFFSLMHGLEEAYIINGDEVIWNKDANGYRLPTEEEWIYAAKGGKNSKYSGGNGIDSVAWYIKNSNGVVNTPSTKDANKYGLYDMTGNVREWCCNDKVEAGEGFKVVKGGSFKSDPKLCEINFSDAVFKDSELDDVGFRMCRTITEKDKEIIGDECDPWKLMMNFSLKHGMGYYEVTQKLYKSIVGNNPSHFIGEDKPVECVSWLDAIKFCNALSKAAGLDEVYLIDGEEVFWNKSAKGFRLPTGNEWYLAASGGDQYIYAGSENLDEIAWFKENSNGETHNVGEKKPNKYGFYDCNGNVCEWVWDEGEHGKVGYVGGSWSFSKNSDDFNITYSWQSENEAYTNIGFRLCRDK